MHTHHVPTMLGYCCECKPNPLILRDSNDDIHFNDECTLFCDKTNTFQEQTICHCQCSNYPFFEPTHFDNANNSILKNLPC